jgi:hypothetical protein
MSTKRVLVEELRAAQERISNLEAELDSANGRREELEIELGQALDQVECVAEWFEGELERVRRIVADALKRTEVAAVIRPLQVAGEIPWDVL